MANNENLTTDEAKAHRFGGPKGNPRNPGGWKKEDTPRYKLEQMMKLTESELQEIANNRDAPNFERKIAIAINKGQWREIESMINQVYGQPKVVQENHNIEYKPLVDLTKRKKNGQ